jgi:hypothetical protein
VFGILQHHQQPVTNDMTTIERATTITSLHQYFMVASASCVDEVCNVNSAHEGAYIGVHIYTYSLTCSVSAVVVLPVVSAAAAVAFAADCLALAFAVAFESLPLVAL